MGQDIKRAVSNLRWTFERAMTWLSSTLASEPRAGTGEKGCDLFPESPPFGLLSSLDPSSDPRKRRNTATILQTALWSGFGADSLAVEAVCCEPLSALKTGKSTGKIPKSSRHLGKAP